MDSGIGCMDEGLLPVDGREENRIIREQSLYPIL
jgi:hypothetical protein